MTQQIFNFVQMPAAVGQSQLGRGFDVGRRVFGRQLQKALQDTNALRAAIFHHRFGPSAGMPSNHPRPIQQPVGAVFNRGSFAGMNMNRVGAEASGLLPGMEGDLLHPLIKDAHHPQLPSCPHFSSHVFRWNRVICFGHFNVAVQMHQARRFAKNRKHHLRQGQ